MCFINFGTIASKRISEQIPGEILKLPENIQKEFGKESLEESRMDPHKES